MLHKIHHCVKLSGVLVCTKLRLCFISIISLTNLTAFPPTIVDYQREVQCFEGEQVTLTVKVTGSPTPTVTWLFNGRKVKDNYSTEVGKDGSLTLITVEPKHAGTYTFTVSNKVGSVEGCTKLVVRAEDEEYSRAPGVESNPIAREKFGEYVSSFHAYNNSAFFGQFQVGRYHVMVPLNIAIDIGYINTITSICV